MGIEAIPLWLGSLGQGRKAGGSPPAFKCYQQL